MTTQQRFLNVVICVAVLINLVIYPQLSWALELKVARP
ncbi:hypothetical protein N836_22005 [Leptolyngbya sp. Heron Island J]|nr:hypothetical protein N836_22005 [Leptolyngbya sp. Heron Island J]